MIVLYISLILLLVLAAPWNAGAECAWVLWHGSGDPLSWQVSDTFDSRQKCVEKVARFGKQFSDDRRSTWYDVAGTERIETGISYRWLVTSPWEHVRCLPDTIDPKGQLRGR